MQLRETNVQDDTQEALKVLTGFHTRFVPTATCFFGENIHS